MSVTKHPYEPYWQIPLGVRAFVVDWCFADHDRTPKAYYIGCSWRLRSLVILPFKQN